MVTENLIERLPDQVEWERGSPTIYLAEAFTALLEMFDPYGPQKPVGGAYHRLKWARISVVFSAFAAEGFINRALLTRLKPRDFAAIDRLSTVEKYAIGPRLAFGQDMFDRGVEPLQTLAELFDLRNRIAHPKPRAEMLSRDDALAGPDAEAFSPTRAVRFAVAVAEASVALATAMGDRSDMFAETVVEMKQHFLQAARTAERLPQPTYDDWREAFARAAR